MPEAILGPIRFPWLLIGRVSWSCRRGGLTARLYELCTEDGSVDLFE